MKADINETGDNSKKEAKKTRNSRAKLEKHLIGRSIDNNQIPIVSQGFAMGLTPREIVHEIDRFVVGQEEAKKAVAIALRNRCRRMQVEEPMRSEITPKNILMIGSTGVGKTEIARRLAKLSDSPFIKVEATKFTEVGYVGRDVESIIRDLLEIAINQHKTKEKLKVQAEAEMRAIELILNVLVGKTSSSETRAKFTKKILNKELDDKEIEIAVPDKNLLKGNIFDIPGMSGAAMGVLNISDILGKTLGVEKTKTKKLFLKDAMEILISEESDKMLDQDKIIENAIKSVENNGIVFIDEIDKITSKSNSRGGEVSREGVQRDLLPLIEGTSVSTKYGTVNSDHILFIASGAFHISRPSDLLPELQGRLPIRVEMKSLDEEDLVKILVEPEYSLIKQYTAMIATEGIKLEFTDKAVRSIAKYAVICNGKIENIGARRLHTILERLLEDISYDLSSAVDNKIIIDEKFVGAKLEILVKDTDLLQFIL